jgi:hypothetical protein
MIDKFKAQSDDGATYTVHEFQEFVATGTKDGDDWIPGLKELKLNDGSRLNLIDENTFEIVQSGTILRRV